MNIASYIDHTVLKPTTTDADIHQLCAEARTYSFAAVCVPPPYVAKASQLLKETTVKIATVIGFPFGYSNTRSKLSEIEDAIADGADELDVVINLASLKNDNWHFVEKEVRSCAARVHESGKIMKLIVESGSLTDEELIKTCRIVSDSNVDFIKTSTGYAETGATVHAVTLMRTHLHSRFFIKASGGIRTFAFAKELIDAGANRLGCSASLQIVKEQQT